MRRNSFVFLVSMIVLLFVIAALLFYIFPRPSASDTVVPGVVVLATLPVSPENHIAPLAEPDAAPIRLIYIVSLLVAFVSAVLVLFKMLLKVLIKDVE